MPVLGLTDEQRTSLKSIDVYNKVFVEDAITVLNSGASDIMPAFIKTEPIQNDLTLYEQMDKLEIRINDLLQKVSDIKRIAGDEAYSMSLAVYKIISAANTAGIAGAKQAYNKLKVRFETQGSGGRTPDTTV
jgi:hypothetical protein